MKIPYSSSAFLAILTAIVSAISIVSVVYSWATALEAFCFSTGAVCVWLVVRENIWNFPIGILNVLGFAIVFFHAKLFADAGLQVVYFFLGCIGWVMWYRGQMKSGTGSTQKQPVGRVGSVELVLLSLLALIGTVTLWLTLHNVGGSASFWDALTTCISLASQWMLNRKQLENWIGWIVADIIYIPLYLYKGLFLTSLLYAVFLAMAIVGLKEWHRRWQSQRLEQQEFV